MTQKCLPPNHRRRYRSSPASNALRKKSNQRNLLQLQQSPPRQRPTAYAETRERRTMLRAVSSVATETMIVIMSIPVLVPLQDIATSGDGRSPQLRPRLSRSTQASTRSTQKATLRTLHMEPYIDTACPCFTGLGLGISLGYPINGELIARSPKVRV